MFETSTKLKNFMLWCKQNKIKAFKNKDIEFELSDMAFIPDTEELKEINLTDSKAFSEIDNMSEAEKEEMLYWSSGR